VKACQILGEKVFTKKIIEKFFENISWFHLQCTWHSFMRHLLKMRGTWGGANRKSIVLARGWVHGGPPAEGSRTRHHLDSGDRPPGQPAFVTLIFIQMSQLGT
jgi:hypothetical protein